MKKQVKNILFITDDFDTHSFKTIKALCEPGIYFYHKEDNYLKFKFSMVGEFPESIPNVDAILIDYGLMDYGFGGLKKAAEFLERAYCNGIRLAWCGGLPHKYNEDARSMFPRQEFLHSLPACSIGRDSILDMLYKGVFPGKSKRKKRLSKSKRRNDEKE